MRFLSAALLVGMTLIFLKIPVNAGEGLSGICGSVASPGGNDSRSCTSHFGDIVAITDFNNVTPASSSSAVLAAYNLAVSACNAGTIGALYIPPGIWNLSANPDPFTNSCHVYGAGSTSKLNAPIGSTLTNFFQGGTDGVRAPRVAFSDLWINYANSPPANSVAVYFPSATDSWVARLVITGAASPFKVGSATASLDPARITISDVSGNMNNGLNDNCNFSVVGGTDIGFYRITMNGVGASNVNATGAMGCIITASGHIIDTLRLSAVGLQSFTSIAAADGKPFGWILDDSAGDVKNISADQFIYADHTTICGIKYQSSNAGTGIMRVHNWNNFRITPDTGQSLCMDMQSGLTVDSITFSNGRFLARDSSTPIHIFGSHDGGVASYTNGQFNGMTITDTASTPTKIAAFNIDADGWDSQGCTVGLDVPSGNSGFQNVLQITNVAITKIQFGACLSPTISSFSSLPTFTTLNAPNRNIWSPSYLGFEFIISGSGSAITTGSKGFIEVPDSCTVTRSTLLADQPGSIVLDILKAAYSGWPTDASIVASAKPTLSSAQKSQDTTLTGWTTLLSAGDILEFNVNSAATITQVTESLQCRKN